MVSDDFQVSTRCVAFPNLGVFFHRPKPLVADVDGCSAVDHDQSVFVTFATTLAQAYIFDFVPNR